MSVFETIAIVGGKAVLAAEHLQRLELAAARLDFFIDRVALRGLADFLKQPPLVEGLLRIHWTAGDGGPADPILEGRWVIRCEEIPLPGSSSPVQDLSLVTVEASLGEWDGWKTGNYLIRCRLLASARKSGADEALLRDGSGLLVGAAMANVFLVTASDRLVTPGIRTGCRNGVVREWVLKHHPVEEREVAFEEVISAKEILLTNSRLGVACVAALDGRGLKRGEISQRVRESYGEFLASHVRRA